MAAFATRYLIHASSNCLTLTRLGSEQFKQSWANSPSSAFSASEIRPTKVSPILAIALSPRADSITPKYRPGSLAAPDMVSSSRNGNHLLPTRRTEERVKRLEDAEPNRLRPA